MIAALLFASSLLVAPSIANGVAAAPTASRPLAESTEEVVERARDLVEAGSVDEALAVLREHVKRKGLAPAAHAELGRLLVDAGQVDAGATHLQAAVEQYAGAGDTRTADKLDRELAKADPLWRKQESVFSKLVRELQSAAERLEDSEQPERALDVLERIQPLATGKDRKKIDSALERLRSTASAVDLDSLGSSPGADGKWPMVEHESEYYELHCALEPAVIERLAETVDSIYLYYVDLYFDGKAKKGSKAKLHIHATWDDMAARWPGQPSPGLGGWWSPSENEAHFYDTRDREGSLQGLLETLFHELGHQFMTKLTRGSGVPSWFNEGTSCFFEGAIAMADGSVTWPDAARSRLGALRSQLRDEEAGKRLVEEALGFTGGGSFAGQYYSVGWGLVYFLQQWEHPETLDYAYRDLYRGYRDEIVGKTFRSRELFDEVFLGERSPLGHADFDAFYADWRKWILEEVGAMMVSSGNLARVRERRVAAIERYLAKAAQAAEERKPRISEQEFLLRALSHIEVVRSQIDTGDRTDYALLLTQADVLERLDRGKNAAPLLELFLDAVDEGRHEIAEEQYAEVERQLAKLDQRNSALRQLRSRTRTNTLAVARLLEDYLDEENPRPLRAFSFAAKAVRALNDKGELATKATELRAIAKEAGLLLGRIEPLTAPTSEWSTAFAEKPKSFRTKEGRVEIAAVRPNGMLLRSVPIEGEYEVRARLVRKGKLTLGSGHGLIVCGEPDGLWFIVGLNSDGHVKQWKMTPSGTAARMSNLRAITLSEPVGEDEDVELAVRVAADGRLTIRVEGREPVTSRLTFDRPTKAHVGVFVRDGELALEDPLVEIFP